MSLNLRRLLRVWTNLGEIAPRSPGRRRTHERKRRKERDVDDDHRDPEPDEDF